MALQDRVVTHAGFQLVIKSGTVTKELRREILMGLEEVSEAYLEKIYKNISLDDHTLEQLAKMGHPYAIGKPANSPHDDRMVHEQSGRLKKSIRLSLPEEVAPKKFSVYVTSDDPILPYLIWGTSKMRPRRFHEKSFNDIKDKYWEPITKRLADYTYKMPVGAAVARRIW